MNPSAITTRTPTVLLQAEQALQQWREVAGGPGFPIPESIWALAVAAAQAVGVATTVRTLRLSRERLKRRMAVAAPVTHDTMAAGGGCAAVATGTTGADANASAVSVKLAAADAPKQSGARFLAPAFAAEPNHAPPFLELRIPTRSEPQGPSPRTDTIPDRAGAVIECSGHGEHLRIELHALSSGEITGLVQAFWSRSCYR